MSRQQFFVILSQICIALTSFSQSIDIYAHGNLKKFSRESFLKQKVWIDTDISIGRGFHEVDDGLALIQALKSPILEILGISYSFGNISNLKKMRRKIQQILRLTNRNDLEGKIFPGPKTSDEIYSQTPAIKKLATLIKNKRLNQKGSPQITFIALGRLSTLASFITHYPELQTNIERVIVNAGRRKNNPPHPPIGKKKTIMPDTNIDGNLDAAFKVINSKVPVVMIPTEIMHDSLVTKKHIDILENATNHIGPWIAKRIRKWRWVWSIFPRTEGFIPWDVFLIDYVINPSLYECDQAGNAELSYQENLTSQLGRFWRKRKKQKWVLLFESTNFKQTQSRLGQDTYCYKFKEDRIKDLVHEWSVFQ